MKIDALAPVNTKARISCVIWGSNGSGKSSLVNEWAFRALQRGRPVIIVDKQRQFLHLGDDVAIQPPIEDLRSGEFLRALVESGWRGLLVLDDLDTYLPKTHNLPDIWVDLFRSYRHLRFDLVIQAARPQETPQLAITSATYLALFRSNGARAKERLLEETDELGDVADEIREQWPTEDHEYLLVRVKRAGSGPRVSKHRTIPMPPESEE